MSFDKKFKGAGVIWVGFNALITVDAFALFWDGLDVWEVGPGFVHFRK